MSEHLNMRNTLDLALIVCVCVHVRKMWIVLLAIRSIQCYIQRVLWHRITIYFYLLPYIWGVTRFSFETVPRPICLVQPNCQCIRITNCKIVTQLLCYSFDLCILGTCHTLYLKLYLVSILIFYIIYVVFVNLKLYYIWILYLVSILMLYITL
jgi:hypothetical protein